MFIVVSKGSIGHDEFGHCILMENNDSLNLPL
jgi:hypothetical protein